jgi:hypothetical protein
MGQAMGIYRTPETPVQQVVESKSYFLHDVFMNVVFPDATIAARSASEIRRQRLMRIAISAAAATLAVIVAAPGVNSFVNNRALNKETYDRAKVADAVDWDSHDPPASKLEKLVPLLERLKEMDEYQKSVPFKLKWGMYQGDVIESHAIAEYVKVIQKAMVKPVRAKLEDKLTLVKGDHYLQERTLLKTYLMLSDVKHLDVAQPRTTRTATAPRSAPSRWRGPSTSSPSPTSPRSTSEPRAAPTCATTSSSSRAGAWRRCRATTCWSRTRRRPSRRCPLPSATTISSSTLSSRRSASREGRTCAPTEGTRRSPWATSSPTGRTRSG